jgi:uroporphyrin-III C-methyltransferase/precorrin-2 dehydrogenase/sirohydrochlorin ferrochelatase
MDYFPIFLRLQGKTVLLVGGGEVALRKARLLLAAKAAVTVVAPQLHPELMSLHAAERLQYHPLPFAPHHLDGVDLVIAATDNEAVNAQVSVLAQARHLPVNVVDAPALCSYITPAIIDRSPLVIALSTGGGVPVLARLLRARLESLIPAGYGRLARWATDWRDRVRARFPDVDERRHFWEALLQGPAGEAALTGREEQASAQLEQALADTTGEHRQGAVYLVGSGPGNPDLLTFRALRLMQQADVVVYDQLVSPEILELVRRDAERVFVGKRRANHTLPQQEINQMLVTLAQQGQRVLRLKGGDPFIFGRGGEEIAELMAHHIPFEVVPGITSASGAAAYAGIPLTHRDHAQSVTFVTGHRQDQSCRLDWPALARPQQTVVIYMGLLMAAEISKQLVAHGRDALTPVAVIERATLASQRVFTTTLADLAGVIDQQQVQSPGLIIVGEVVSLREHLDWRH